MDVIISTFILLAIICLLFYILKSNDDKNSSIPYVTYQCYPIVGHLFSFLRDRTKFLISCQERYGKCFKIRLFNQRFTLILSSSDWLTVVRNPSFSQRTDNFVVKVFDAFSNFSEHPDFETEVHRQYVQYLQNHDGLRPLIIEFVHRIREQMQHQKTTLKNNSTISEWISSGLLEVSHRMIFQPSTYALFGDIEPLSLEKNFQLFDNSFHYFYVGIPRLIFSWFFPQELKARARLNTSWLKNLHPSGESEFMQARKILFQNNSDWFTDRDLGSCQTIIFWASFANTIPAVCWSLFYILSDAKAVGKIREEIDKNLPYFSLDNNPDGSQIEEWTPEQLNACVYLESAINETLRLAGAALLTRKCYKETQIILQDGRTLVVKPNETVAYFVGATHLDANLFPEPNKFIFDRFLNKTVEGVPGFMPFGAGKRMCPGRFFAKNEMKICLAMLLRYVEYKFIETKIIPQQKPQRIGFGVAPPNEDIPIMYRYRI